MRQTFHVFGVLVALALFCAPTAHAGITCKVIPTMCPPEPGDGHDRDGGSRGNSVPEPGTLVLLMGGAGAAGAALRRRRDKP